MTIENLKQDLQQKNIKQFKLLKRFKHFTKTGNGVYEVNLIYIDDDYNIIEHSYYLIRNNIH